MNTSSLTSEQVLAWLHEQAAASGIKGVEIMATTNSLNFIASVKRPFVAAFADTPEQALSQLRGKIPVAAAKLLAEAEALTAAPVSA